MKIICLIFASLIFSNCNKIKEEFHYTFKTHDYKYNVFDLIDDYELIPLEQTQFSKYSFIWKLFLFKDNFLIWDRVHGNITVHDRYGKYYSSIKNDNNLSWSDIKNVEFDSKTNLLYIADFVNGIFIYDIQKATLIKNIKRDDLHPTASISDNKYIYIIRNNFDQKGLVWTFKKSDYLLVNKNESIQFPLYANKITSIFPFSRLVNTIRLNTSFNNGIYSLSEGKIMPYIKLGAKNEQINNLTFNQFNSLFDKSIDEKKLFYQLPELKDILTTEGSCFETNKLYFAILNKSDDQYLFVLNKQTNEYNYIAGKNLKNCKYLFSFYQIRPIYIDEFENFYFSFLPTIELKDRLDKYLVDTHDKTLFYSRLKLLLDEMLQKGNENPIIFKCKMNVDQLLNTSVNH